MLKKYSQFILAITILAFLFSAQLLAQGKKKTPATKKSECKQTECTDACADKAETTNANTCKDKSEMKAANSSKINNKICPVMGEDVDASVETVDYNGKTIGFCCKKCVAKFKKDPEKYMKKFKDLDKEG
jgi:YHS domain-containing protein